MNIKTGRIENVLRIPAASFQTSSAFMIPYAQGLAVDGSRAYIGLWNHVAIVDLDSFCVVDTFSAPEMADVHSITIDGKHIYIASTATECVLCIDKTSHETLWRWGPNEDILSTGQRALLPSFGHRYYRSAFRKMGLANLLRTPQYRGEETRYIHKSMSRYYRHHLNNVSVLDGSLYISTKGWFDDKRVKSSVIRLDLATRQAEFFVPPGSFKGAHDGEVKGDWYYVTESINDSVSRVHLTDKRIERFNLEPRGFFVRGLADLGECWAVGFTPERTRNDKAAVGLFTKDDFTPLSMIKVPDIYGTSSDERLAVHTIINEDVYSEG